MAEQFDSDNDGLPPIPEAGDHQGLVHDDDLPPETDDEAVELSTHEERPVKKGSNMLLVVGGLIGVLVFGAAGYFVLMPSAPAPVAQIPPPHEQASPEFGPDLNDPGAIPSAPPTDALGLTDPAPVPPAGVEVAPLPETPAHNPLQAAAVAPAPVVAAAVPAPVKAVTPAPVAQDASPKIAALTDRVAVLEEQLAELSRKVNDVRNRPAPVSRPVKTSAPKVAAPVAAPVYEPLPGYSIREKTSDGKNVVVRTPTGATVLLSKGDRLRVNGKALTVTALEAKAGRLILANRYVITTELPDPKGTPPAGVVVTPLPEAPSKMALVEDEKFKAAIQEARNAKMESLKEATGWRVNAVFSGQADGKSFLVQRPDSTFVRVGLGDTLPGLGVVRDASKDGRLTVGSYVIRPER